jgi:hypothetical protein
MLWMAFFPLFSGKLTSLASSYSIDDTMPTPLVAAKSTGKTKIAQLKMGDSLA